MSASKKLATAALTGLLSMGIMATGIAHAEDGAANPVEKTANAEHPIEKHACKGKNACKGNGGCKTEQNSCKGQNACKGKGGCKTEK